MYRLLLALAVPALLGLFVACAVAVPQVPCPEGQKVCPSSAGDQCVSLESPTNCGDCGVTCKPEETCHDSICTVPCAPGGGACIDAVTRVSTCAVLRSDPLNCGACGRLCPEGFTCLAGECTVVCPIPLVDCGGSCVNRDADNLNCGGCGKRCPAGTVCSLGVCKASCTAGLTDCNGSCRDLKTDNQNCGGCSTSTASKACDPGKTCKGGVCQLVCLSNQLACGGACVTPTNDPNNCGGCSATDASKKCTAGQVCSNGQCASVCGVGLNGVQMTDCGGSCRDLQNDFFNCGGCSSTSAPRACKAGEQCVSGQCQTVCQAGLALCNGACVDVKADRANCGGCGAPCAGGEVCSGGVCKTSCGAGLTDCGGTCRDLLTDSLNCGQCSTGSVSHACAAGSKCVNGGCQLDCPPGMTACNGECRDTRSDPQNCGGCSGLTATDAGAGPLPPSPQPVGSVCATGEVCSGGVCTTGCGATATNCSGGCKDLQNDPNNCGACGRICPAPAGTQGAACFAGACSYTTCAAGFSDCDKATAGCETNTASSLASCGGCGIKCGPANVTTAQCVSGACTYDTCRPGFADCDAIKSNGCEARLDDDLHCGSCTNACKNGATCQGGACAVSSYLFPGGAEATSAQRGRDTTYVLATPGASTIHYTLDGTLPTVGGGTTFSVASPAMVTLTGSTNLIWYADFGSGARESAMHVFHHETALCTGARCPRSEARNIVEKTSLAASGGANGPMPIVVTAAGTSLSGTAAVEAWKADAFGTCATCQTQFYLSLEGSPQAPLCIDNLTVYPGVVDTQRSLSLKAPSTPGVYRLLATMGFDSGCRTAAPAGGETVGLVFVQ